MGNVYLSHYVTETVIIARTTFAVVATPSVPVHRLVVSATHSASTSGNTSSDAWDIVVSSFGEHNSEIFFRNTILTRWIIIVMTIQY